MGRHILTWANENNAMGMTAMGMTERGKQRLALTLTAITSAICGGTAMAQDEVYMEHERHGAWEFTLHYDRLSSEDYTGIADAVLEADNSAGWGMTVGYNFTNQLLVSMELMSATPDYYAVVDGEVMNPNRPYEMDLSSTQFSGTWHLRPDGLTPFVTAGIGWTNVDSNISSDEVQSDCWWDGWWGYTCSSYYVTYNDTRFSARAAAGMRWDFHTNFFTRASIGKLWLEPGDSNASSPTTARLEIGFRR